MPKSDVLGLSQLGSDSQQLQVPGTLQQLTVLRKAFPAGSTDPASGTYAARAVILVDSSVMY